MDRMTEEYKGKNIIPLRNGGVTEWCIGTSGIARGSFRYLSGDAADKLAAYEETGLEPEICAEYKKFEDNVIKSGTTLRYMLDLAAAEQEGRLVVLPEPEQEGGRHDLI